MPLDLRVIRPSFFGGLTNIGLWELRPLSDRELVRQWRKINDKKTSQAIAKELKVETVAANKKFKIEGTTEAEQTAILKDLAGKLQVCPFGCLNLP